MQSWSQGSGSSLPLYQVTRRPENTLGTPVTVHEGPPYAGLRLSMDQTPITQQLNSVAPSGVKNANYRFSKCNTYHLSEGMSAHKSQNDDSEWDFRWSIASARPLAAEITSPEAEE